MQLAIEKTLQKPRAFGVVLLLIALAGFAIRMHVGLKTFVSFDEWQHVFMASSPRWEDLSFELRTNAHPPLFFLLLKWIVRLGNTALYRAISIAAGVGSIVIAGLITRRLFESSLLQVACAAAFAFSADAISVSCEIRSYQLAVFFVLVAFLGWLSMLDEGSLWAYAIFAVFLSLALLTHYSAAFFLGAAVVFSAIFARKTWALVVSLAIPCAVFAIEYFTHAGEQPMQGYLFDYYLDGTRNEAAGHFLLRNARNFFDLFSPIQVRGTGLALIAIALLTGLAVSTAIRSSKSRLSILFAGAIVIEIVLAAMVDKYPFGGMLRHQYIAGPFLLIALFAILDTIPATPIVSALAVTVSAINLALAWPSLILYPGVTLLADEYNTWRATFPQAQGVYTDHWGVIGYMIHTSDQPRTLVRHVSDTPNVDQYQTPDGVQIFYDKSDIVLNLSDPSAYRSFADCLRASGIHELTLFFYSPGEKPFARSAEEMENLVTQKAETQGLRTTKIAVGASFLVAGFELQ
jgi:4-amino-4-deoxy-L-arabinose transferase-like glycosyltransferase